MNTEVKLRAAASPQLPLARTGYTRHRGRQVALTARSVRFALFSLRALSRDDAGIAGPIRRSDRCVSATRPTQHLRIVVANLNRQGLQFRYTARHALASGYINFTKRARARTRPPRCTSEDLMQYLRACFRTQGLHCSTSRSCMYV